MLPTPHLGSQSPAHLDRWRAALMAGQRAAAKCEATTRTGAQCRFHVIPGTRRCTHHLVGAERDAYDRNRIPKLQRMIDRNVGGRITIARARKSLANIARRQLHRLWKIAPDAPGSTLGLPPRDEQRVRNWLRNHGIDLDAPAQYLTPRCIDRVRWAAFMKLRGGMPNEAARRRLVLALRDDTRWQQKQSPASEV